jgi:hypothetical protein
MGKYLINGSKYEISEDIQGEELTRTLEQLAGTKAEPSAPAKAPPGGDRIKSYLDETDTMLKLTPGTSYAQLMQESKMNPMAVSRVGAKGIAQIMPTTQASLEKRFNRKFDPTNVDDSLFMHRELMRENMGKFQNEEDALRAYNGGWDKTKWTNKETSDYVPKIASLRTNRPYQSFGPIRKDIDPKTLNDDQDWLTASSKMYQMRERKQFDGSPQELAEWGKKFMAEFNYNMVDMTRYAHSVNTQGSQEDKEAFLWMMDTYDNTNVSWEGAGRAARAIATDPTSYVGLGTLGAGTAGKIAGTTATKQGVKTLLLQGLGRTGVIAGIEGGMYGAADSTIKQSVEVSAGRKQSTDLGQVALGTGVGALGGVVLGTAGDAAVTGIRNILKGAPKAVPTPKVAPTLTPEVPPSVIPETPVDTSALPSGSILTPTETAEAMARKQKFRLPEDDIIPTVDTNVPSLDVPQTPTGLRSTSRNMAEVTSQGEEIARQLRDLDDSTLTSVLEKTRGEARTLEEHGVISRGLQMYADELSIREAELIKLKEKNPGSPKIQEWTDELTKIEGRRSAVLADDAYGSFAGSLLRQRQEGLPGMEGVTVKSLMEKEGLAQEDAEKVFASFVEKARDTAEAKQIAENYNRQIAEALEAGDLKQVAKLAVMKNRELDGLVDKATGGGSGWVNKVTEFAISNVFSPTTVMVNLVPSGLKTAILPAVRALVSDPLQRATRAELTATYSAMRSTFGAAWRAAKASYRYEQSLLTRDSARLLEGELAIQGKKGGVIRFLPRILNATDEMLGQINYNGYIAGKAAAKATDEGIAKGLSGKELKVFVKEAVKSASEAAYKQNTGEELIQPIVNKGVNLGLTGDELMRYVEREAVRDPSALRHGQDEEALDFVKDVLYKRKFSGNGMASSAATLYEDGMNKFPAAKLVLGQLFFRTPIRVFEEGIRMTPGLQIIAPGFLKDLAGKNGAGRQARAQGEALASLAITGAVFSLYAEGKIVGDGAYGDWKQNRHRNDSALPGSYTMQGDDGDAWSFRGFDPLATPVKIMVNALERMDKLAIREAQGELIEKSEWSKLVSAMSVGTTAVASALRDANLLAGLDGSIKFFEALGDPEGKETAWLKLLGEKLRLAVPNTMHKIAKENDPDIKDPANFWQVVDARLFGAGPDDIKTSKSYDVLGNVRQPADNGTLWNIFSVATPEERARGKSEEAQVVMAELDRLSRETGQTFAPPLKHQLTGAFDLRTVMTSDGKETLYDRWQKNYKELQPENILYPIVTAPMPDGTFKHKGMRGDIIKEVTGQLRDAAFMKLISEEQRVIDELIKKKMYEAKTSAGMNDFNNLSK